jgi:hypothetical protein
MVGRRVVYCEFRHGCTLGRVASIHVALKFASICVASQRRNLRRFASQHRVIKSTIIRVYLRHNVEIRVGLRRNNFVMFASQVVVCYVKLSRVNSHRIKIRVDLRHVNIRVDLRRVALSLVRP